jgi:hypothetical protein
MIEQSKAIVGGAIARDESRGAHFKMDTPNRDDEHWLRTTLAKWTSNGPEFSYEKIDTRFIAPRARKYKINQNKIVLQIMGPEALQGVGAEQLAPEPVAEPEPVKTEAAKEPEPDPFAEMKARLEKAEKALKDTQAWGTKNAQELAAIRKERERQATRPAILDANPELEQAIKYVVPVQEINPEQVRQNEWRQIVETAHPGIFDTDIDPELEKAVLARFDGLGGAQSDPLIAIREITAEKLAFAERQLGKRLIAETAKANQKSAMSVPGAGSGGAHKATVDSDLEAVNRINSMSSAEFERERQKALKLI